MVSLKDSVGIPLKDLPSGSEFFTFEGFGDDEHIAVAFAPWKEQEVPLVRVHSECLTGEVFGSELCDCGPQLHEALKMFSREGGILLYLRQEGRGIGLYAKLAAYRLQQKGLDTFEANRCLNLPEDARSFEPAAQMLKAMGVSKVRLLSNNPDKAAQLQNFGIEVTEVLSTGVFGTKSNRNYLAAKVSKRQHRIKLDDGEL
ncbi:GTP cyclohydrolase II [Chitinimonas sp. PSY-7]|uniref:GTP cyclohydrolase II RibA n=1 Tax=Chitinimonas sp. PSY-7 TaxID=3459088 RepID=UPI0040400643